MIRKLIATGLIALLATTAACSSSTPHWVEEDEPGWDCHTMGNRTCGDEGSPNHRTVPAGTICSDSAMTLNCQFPPGCAEEDNPLMPDGKEIICQP